MIFPVTVTVGVIIVGGVGTVIGMVALINGFQRSFQQSIQSLGNNTIYIRRIRQKIEPNPDEPKILLTVRGFGYKIAQTEVHA